MRPYLRKTRFRGFAVRVLAMLTLGITFTVLTGCEVDRVPFNRLEEGKKFLAAGEPFQAAKYFEQSIEREKDTRSIALAHLVVAYDLAKKKAAGIPAKEQPLEGKRVETLFRIRKDPDAIAHLTDILEYHNTSSQSAKQILTELGGDAADALLLAYRSKPVEQQEILGILAAIGAPAISQIEKAITGQGLTSHERAGLIRLLAAMGNGDTKAFLAQLRENQSDPGIRTEAAVALYRLGEKSERQFLIEQLDSDNTLARRAAAFSMLYLNDKPDPNVLIRHLDDADNMVRLHLVDALGKHHYSKDGITALIRVIRQDEDDEVTNAAVASLAQYGADVIDPALDALAVEPDWTRRQRLVRVLAGENVREGFDQDRQYRLYEYWQKREKNTQVKGDIARLLKELETN